MKGIPSVGDKGNFTENELYSGNSFFERIAMSSPGLAAVIRGRDTKILFANKMFEEYTGYSREHHDSKYFSGFLEPFQRDRFYRHLQEVFEHPEAGNSFVIYNLLDTANEYKSFYVYASPVATNGNEEEQLFHLFLLLDRSKWGMPFTSFDTRELFLELFKAEDFGTFEWIIDVDKVYWSEGLYRIYEVDKSTKEIDLNFIKSYIHPHDRDMVMKQINDAVAKQTDINIEYRIVTLKSHLKLIHCVARAVADNGGRSVKLAGSIRDITAQRSIESNMRDMVDELHRSNRELEEFAYAASHDLQEPLRKITTFSDRLSEKYKNVLVGEGEMYLSRMVASAENMRLLINGLLEFSKITQTSAPFESVDLNNVLKEVMNDLELKIEETGTAIRCSGLPVVDAVMSQMKQLFLNLIGNAIKFHKPDVPPIIRIELQDITESELQRFSLQHGKRYFKIAVTDNGIGFESEYASRIFQVFQRLHGKSEYPGSGIGLAICKKIVEYHHGVVYAENIPGTGARFVFILPEHQ